MRDKIAVLGLVVVMALAGATVAAIASQQALPESMFGFALGEERRYVLGPPDAIVEGERIEWSITLAEISANGGRVFAAFDLGLESRWAGAASEEQFGRSLRGRLIVNNAGFPGSLTVSEQFHDISLVTRYLVQADRTFEMTVGWPDEEFSVPIPIPEHANLDLDRQEGLFLFEMRETLSGTLKRDPDRAGFGPTEYRRPARDAGRDRYEELLLNPGLLSIALTAQVAMGDDALEFLSFAPPVDLPRYPDGELMSQLNRRSGVRRLSFSRMRIRGEGTESIQVGDRTVVATRLEVQGPFGRAYEDTDGRVLLIELEPTDGRRMRHIRLLWPSEY